MPDDGAAMREGGKKTVIYLLRHGEACLASPNVRALETARSACEALGVRWRRRRRFRVGSSMRPI